MKIAIFLAIFAVANFAIAFDNDEDGKLWGTNEERAEIIKSAISEAKMNARMKEAASRAKMYSRADQGPTAMDMLARGFKKPSKKAIANGRARILLESTVKMAERKLFELKRSKDTGMSTSEKAEFLTKELFHMTGSILRESEIREIVDNVGCVNETVSPRFCRGIATVNKFRTINGICNNINNPLFGASGVAFRRLIPALYEDGVNAQRGLRQALLVPGARGPFVGPHPSARTVSRTIVLPKRGGNEGDVTHALMQWGQFLDHDLDLGPEIEEECESCIFTEICQPIRIERRDNTFGVGRPNNGDCLPFRRAVAVCRPERSSRIGPREQLNDVTSFIDGSMIYGSNREQEDAVRSFRNGRLRSNGNALPRIRRRDEFIACPGREDCFLCGEVRCNEQVSLTTMHTIWVRYHNLIARRLQSLNRHWNDERLFQETRKIVGAIIQKITYQDYLPIVLGNAFNQTVGSRSSRDRNFRYNSRLNPGVLNAFATAAYRYGHSLINPRFDRFGPRFTYMTPLNLKDMFFNPPVINNQSATDAIVRGWVSQLSLRMDEFLNRVLTTRLFEQTTLGGMDLASLNIQRQRDHGMPGYGSFQRLCRRLYPTLYNGLINRNDPFFIFENELSRESFRNLYNSNLNNIDLWVAGIAERRTRGSLLGPTFACIFGQTFTNVRDGDRFFFLNRDIYPLSQQRQIERVVLSKVLCDSTTIRTIPRNAFRRSSRVPCSTLPDLNLSPWREQVTYMRVDHNTDNAQFALQSFESTKESTPTLFTNEQSEKCIAMVAPTSSKDVAAFVFPHIKDKNSCRFKSELSYRSIEGESSSFYHPKITEDLIREENGFYKTLEDCERGLSAAVTYTCDENLEVVSSSTIELNDHDITPFENIQNPDSYTQVPDGLVEISEAYMAGMTNVDANQMSTDAAHDDNQLEEELLKIDAEKTHLKTDQELINELADTLEVKRQ